VIVEAVLPTTEKGTILNPAPEEIFPEALRVPVIAAAPPDVTAPSTTRGPVKCVPAISCLP